MFDKRQSPKLSLTPITKYSLADAMMSEHMSINIMYSQCFRALSVCHQWQSFASACGGVLYELYMAGHSFHKLHSRMCRFFRMHLPLYPGVSNIHVHNLVKMSLNTTVHMGLLSLTNVIHGVDLYSGLFPYPVLTGQPTRTLYKNHPVLILSLILILCFYIYYILCVLHISHFTRSAPCLLFDILTVLCLVLFC